MKIFHLKGLNGLRAIAALVVIGCHTSQRLGYHFLDEASSYGVTIFFALSGFLITLLLIKERERTKTISLKNFYIRRTLRIWPLYFLYIGLSLAIMYFVFAETYHFSSVLPYLIFIPNYTIVFGKPIPIIWHFWSLGVEEQFYLFWPFLLSLFAPRFLSFTISFTLAFLLIKGFISYHFGGWSLNYSFIYATRFDCMSIGAIGACLFHYNHKAVSILGSKLVETVAWLFIILVMLNWIRIYSIIIHEVAAAATVALIIAQATQRSFVKLENRFADYLGKISFGLYVYHPLIILLLYQIFSKIGIFSDNLGSQLLFTGSVLFFSIFIAHLSFKFFESPFLKIKNKYSTIKSTEIKSSYSTFNEDNEKIVKGNVIV